MFPSGRGGPSVPADVMAAVITLQALHGLSDNQTVDAVTFDLRWKTACGLVVTDAAFHATTLTYWRRRLAHRILGHLSKTELGPKAADAVALLALIAGQDVEPVEGSDGTDGRWRIARNVAPDRVISTVDPEARHAHKTVHRRQDGFKAHLVIEPDTGIVTDCALSKGSGDAAVGIELLAGESAPVRVLADSVYGSGELRAELVAGGHVDLVKPAPTRSAVPGGFTVDHTNRTVTCPAGATRNITHAQATQYSIRRVAAAHYGPAAPPASPGRRCTCGHTTRYKERHAFQREIRTGSTNIVNIGRWWSVPSHG
ncbi:hypothetical protein HNP02_008632 [Mycobacterium sp. AZCC_0083]|nr:hypothetical protein [Mycobacterium sp. AZCC_0083]